MTSAVQAVDAKAVKKDAVRGWLRAAVGLGLGLVGGVAMATTSGPFGDIESFVSKNFLPFIGVVGLAGGVGYAGIHAFKHDYGKAGVGVATAGGGGFLVVNSSWFATKAGISAATIGAHAPLAAAVLHGLAASVGLGL